MAGKEIKTFTECQNHSTMWTLQPKKLTLKAYMSSCNKLFSLTHILTPKATFGFKEYL